MKHPLLFPSISHRRDSDSGIAFKSMSNLEKESLIAFSNSSFVDNHKKNQNKDY